MRYMAHTVHYQTKFSFLGQTQLLLTLRPRGGEKDRQFLKNIIYNVKNNILRHILDSKEKVS